MKRRISKKKKTPRKEKKTTFKTIFVYNKHTFEMRFLSFKI